eukprot:g9395.t2
MEPVKAALGAWKKIDDAISGEKEVKDMMRSRIGILKSIQETLIAANISSPEVDKLKLIEAKIKGLHDKHTACEGESKQTKALKKFNRGLIHQGIRDELAKFDGETVLLLAGINTILTIRGQVGGGVGHSCGLGGGSDPPKYHQQGVVARDRLVKLWHGRLNEHAVKGAAVGMFGMGGMGKTTVAKALCDEYEQRGWLTFVVAFDLRPSSVEQVCSFQKSSLKALEPTLNVEGWTTEQMQSKLAALVRGPTDGKDAPSNICLVLDNVHSTSDAEKFLGCPTNWVVGEHCRLLLTGRNMEILSRICGQSNTYEVDELECWEAKQLFKQSATLPVDESEDEEELVREAMEYLAFSKSGTAAPHYHPLATKVLGGALRGGRSPEAKQRRLKAFIRGHHDVDMEHAVNACLETSFDMLDDDHQRLFMDVALCLPSIVSRRDDVVEWCSWNENSSGSPTSLQVDALEQACLIKFERVPPERLGKIPCLRSPATRRGVVAVHDLLTAMAEKLAKKPSLRERRILHAVGRDEDDRDEEDSTDDDEGFPPDWLNGVDSVVDSIRFVLVKSETSNLGDVAHLTSNRNIVVAHVMSCTKLERLPCIKSKLLRSIDLSYGTAIVSLPTSWAGKRLRFLSLRGCASLTELPFDQVELPHLRVLDMSGCLSLKSVPALRMRKLRMLNLSFCEGLSELPSLTGVPSLEELYMRCCTSVLALDSSIGTLRELRILNLNSCTALRRLPAELGECQQMAFLELGACALDHASLKVVFALSNLRFLLMERFRFDDGGLEGIEELSSLTLLDVCWTSNLRRLPMRMPTSLEVISIWMVTSLQIDEQVAAMLAGLRNLKVVDCFPTLGDREADLLHFQPGMKDNVVDPFSRAFRVDVYEAASYGHAGEASYGYSIVRALGTCRSFETTKCDAELYAATFNLQLWVDSDGNRRVFLDNEGAPVLINIAMRAISGPSARRNAAVALANVAVSYAQEVFDALDLGEWFRASHQPNSGKVHDHELCRMVVRNCCGWDKTEARDVTRQLAGWIARSQTEELCMECIETLLETYRATGRSANRAEGRA